MSSPIWTPAALWSERRRRSGTCWRLVEAQHKVSTLKLVDSLDEQAVLEGLLETSKPPVPPECRHLHYLLSTPFRYGAPYPQGSRFRRAGMTRGVFYGSQAPEIAVAEMAFHRLLFFAESPATPWPSHAAEFTAFSIEYATRAALDLMLPPLARDRASWMHPTAYGPCQALADAARQAGIGLIRYASVRDPQHRANVALLECRAFAAAAPRARQTWRIRFSPQGAQAICDFPDVRIGFDCNAFGDDLASPRSAGIAEPPTWAAGSPAPRCFRS